jgi:hypothetical protein
MEPLHYLDHSIPANILQKMVYFPVSLQEAILQGRHFSLEFIASWHEQFQWRNQVRGNSFSSGEQHSLRSPGNVLSMIKSIQINLQRQDARTTALERFITIANYLKLLDFAYKNTVATLPSFMALRASATEMCYQYTPDAYAEGVCFVFFSLWIASVWKTGNLMSKEGLHLIRDLQDRFPRPELWAAVMELKKGFPGADMSVVEWQDKW